MREDIHHTLTNSLKKEPYKNPIPTVDIIIYNSSQEVVLISRKNPPLGFALPGGFVDLGETVEHAAIREAFEETGIDVSLQGVLGVYSCKDRDPRFHTISIVFVSYKENIGVFRAGDDALQVTIYSLSNLPSLVFDHEQILFDFREFLQGKRNLAPTVG